MTDIMADCQKIEPGHLRLDGACDGSIEPFATMRRVDGYHVVEIKKDRLTDQQVILLIEGLAFSLRGGMAEEHGVDKSGGRK